MTGDSKGGKTMAKTLEELRAENPELAEQILAQAKEAVAKESVDVNAAVEAERKRIAEIDEIAALYDDELVREAKFGEKPMTAQELAWEAAKKEAHKRRAFLDDADKDFKASGADKVVASATVEDETKLLTPEERMAQGRADAKRMQTKEEK
jgi:RNA 3'-terminal phosphate cyclase